MPRRPGMTELARAAGVSVATVDRFLNGRQSVHPDTGARIAEAARQIGHPAAARLAPVVADLPVLRFGVVLHKQGQDFYKAFAEALHQAVAMAPGVRGRLVLEFSASQSPAEMASHLRAMAGRCDALAATAVNHPEVTAAVEDLTAGGLPVFALLSDFAEGARRGYLGLDNLKHGRTAGWIVALAAQGQPGRMAVFVGGHRWHGHDLRETGFRSYLRECAPGITVLEPLVNLETRQLTYEATLALIARHPDLRGIYVAGGGMEGAIAVLSELRLPTPPALVVSALTPASRAGLAEGVVTMVIDTPLDKLCREMVARMTAAVLATDPAASAPPGPIFLPPDIHVAESL